MANSISQIEGIGPANAKKLKKCNIGSVGKLLKDGCTKKGRKEIAKESGVDESKILKWVNMADLFRIKGVASEYSELLEAAGVDTVKELRNRNAANLHAKMEEINAKKKLVRRTPSASQVDGFVKHAKKLKPMVAY